MARQDKAFQKMVQEFEQSIYSICHMYARNEGEAKDLLQETLINLWKGFSKFRGESSLRTWVTRVAINTCISASRKRKVETVDESFIPALREVPSEPSAQVQDLHSRLLRLSYLERAIVLLWLEDMPYDEIGAIIGLSAKNVGVKLVRIKNKLKEMSHGR